MSEFEKRSTGLLNATDELRQLIIENPGVPMLVFASEDCNSGDYYYMTCSGCHAALGEFLDCVQGFNEERVYTDREEFREDLDDHLFDSEYDKKSWTDVEWDALVDKRMQEYEPYWRKCIILYVDN